MENWDLSAVEWGPKNGIRVCISEALDGEERWFIERWINNVWWRDHRSECTTLAEAVPVAERLAKFREGK